MRDYFPIELCDRGNDGRTGKQFSVVDCCASEQVGVGVLLGERLV